MIEYALNAIAARYKISERDMQGKGIIKSGGMEFEIHSYEAEGSGNFSTVSMTSVQGPVNMQTLVFTPIERDAPLFSFDRVLAMGSDTLIMEIYDTQLSPCNLSSLYDVKSGCADLPDLDLGSHWYDSIKKDCSIAKKTEGEDARYRELFEDYFGEYLKILEKAPGCDPAAKRMKTAEYADGLCSKGGPAVDQFKAMLGEEAARELFTKYIFSSCPSSD